MNRERVLTVLYELAIVIGGEIRLRPLLTKTLQRFLYHTSFPCGTVFLDPAGRLSQTGPNGPVGLQLELSIGDFELAPLNGTTVDVPAELIRGPAELVENPDLLNALPCRKDYYRFFLRLPIDGSGLIILLSPSAPEGVFPIAGVFQPVLSNLSKAIELCRSNEAYTERLLADRGIAVDALQELSYRNRLILDSVGEGICGLDEAGNITFINPAATQMLGFAPGELVGQPLHDVVHHRNESGDAVPGHQCPVLQTIREGTPHRIADDLFARKDGTTFPVEYVCTPLRENEHTVGAVVVFRDITERKHAEAEIRQLAMIVESSDDAIIGKSLDGTILSWNRGAKRIYGYTAGEMKGRSISLLATPENPDETLQILEKIRRGEHVDHYESTRVRKDGRRIQVSLTVSPVLDAEGAVKAASVITRDITERKDAERRTEVINRLLMLFTQTVARKEYLEKVLDVLREWSGCRYAGVRVLRPDGALPMEACAGYSADFLRKEGTLALGRDQCICTRVAAGAPESAEQPSMTADGSFYSNDSLQFVEGLDAGERGRFRAVCMQHGFASIAVVPVRYRDKALGVIHIADERRDMVPLQNVRFLEQMAHVLGEALFRFGIEDDLRQNVSELRSMTELLDEQKRFAESLIAHAGVPTFVLNPDHTVVLWNKACEEITGVRAEEVIGTDRQWRPFYAEQRPTLADVVIDGAYDRLDALYGAWRRSQWSEKGLRAEGWFPDLNRRRRFMVFEAVPIFSSKGELAVVVETLHDLTDRKLAENDLKKLNRALQTLSTCNMTLIHAREEGTLLQDICKVLTDVGGFSMAWVGYAEHDEDRTIRPVALAGREEGYLGTLTLTWDGSCDCPASVPIRTGTPYMAQHIADVPEEAPWRAEALRRRYASCISFPLMINSHVIGSLNIYADEAAAFTDEEMVLLTELAGDLSFGIATLRMRLERDLAVEERRRYLEKLRKAATDTVQAIASIVEMRDPYISGHQQRVAQLAVAIAEELGLAQERVDSIHFASLIHDIGKIYVPAEFLSRPGLLMSLEMQVIRTHAEVGYTILKDIDFPWPVAKMIHQHHEFLDGSGYPQGLKGEEIMLEARIVAVADAVEAMVSHRPYRPARGVGVALEEIHHDSGKRYDPAVVDACLNLFWKKRFRFSDAPAAQQLPAPSRRPPSPPL